jgi:hypothetical protein
MQRSILFEITLSRDMGLYFFTSFCLLFLKTGVIFALFHWLNQISEIKLCENEVEDVLKVINPTKVSGPDLINPRLLKEAAPIIKHPFCKLFYLSLRVASYPCQWKRANITPVLKNNKQIPEICLTMFHPFLQEEFMFVIFWIKSLLDLSLVFLTKHVTSFLIFLNLFQIPKEQTYLIYIFIKTIRN